MIFCWKLKLLVHALANDKEPRSERIFQFSSGTWDGNKKDQSLVLQSIKFKKYISAKGIWSNLRFLPFLPTDVDHWWFCRYRYIMGMGQTWGSNGPMQVVVANSLLGFVLMNLGVIVIISIMMCCYYHYIIQLLGMSMSIYVII